LTQYREPAANRRAPLASRLLELCRYL
jgi:hypothetical protein